MDSVFFLEGEARSNFLQSIGQALGCTYICLWSYVPPNNVLICVDGWYNDDGNMPSTSSASVPRMLFDEYKRCPCSVGNSSVPGFAFRDGLPYYLELQVPELLNSASTEIQRRFYQEARIQTAVFNGCRSGVVELGMSSPTHRNILIEMGRLFPEDFIQLHQLRDHPRPTDQSRPSSSSSSLRSLSVGSPEYSSLLRNLVTAPFMAESIQEPPIQQAIRPTFATLPTHQLTMQAYGQLRNIYFPTPASEEAAMTRAMLAIIPSPSSSSSSHHLQNPAPRHQRGNRRTAFRAYDSSLAPIIERRTRSYSENKMKRMFAFLSTIRPQMQEGRPTSNQLHHMISERKRREKLNESFQALRALLPPGSKKDKASVLSKTREYLIELREHVLQLQEKNRSLEARLLSEREAYEEAGGAANERIAVQVVEAPESSSQVRRVELRVIVREEDCEMTDLLLQLLSFLKQMQEVSVVSIDADTQIHEDNRFHRANLRLQIEANEWDVESFKAAVTRVLTGMRARAPPTS